MNIPEKIEIHLLSSIRILGLVGFVVVLIATCLIVLSMLGQATGDHVMKIPVLSARDVLSQLPASEQANDGLSGAPALSTSALPEAYDLTIPSPLRGILLNNETSQTALGDWLSKVPGGDRQVFVNELSAVVTLATQHAASWEWDDRERYVASAMNRYAQDKIRSIDRQRTALSQWAERSDEYHTSLGTLLGLVAVFSTGVTLLAIERNTRPLRQSRSKP